MKQITVRIYTRHDLDLVALAQAGDIDIAYEMREALRAYVRGQKYHVPTPPRLSFDASFTDIQLSLCMDQTDDREVIAFVNSLRSGYRNSFIKNLFRSCLDRYCGEVHYTDATRPLPEAKEEVSVSSPRPRKRKQRSAMRNTDNTLKTPGTTKEQARKVQDPGTVRGQAGDLQSSGAAMVQTGEAQSPGTMKAHTPTPERQASSSANASSGEESWGPPGYDQGRQPEPVPGPKQGDRAGTTRGEDPSPADDAWEDTPDDGFDLFGAIAKMI